MIYSQTIIIDIHTFSKTMRRTVLRIPLPDTKVIGAAGALLLGILALNLYFATIWAAGSGSMPHSLLILLACDVLAITIICAVLQNRYLKPLDSYASHIEELLAPIADSLGESRDLTALKQRINTLITDQAGMRSRENLLIDNAVDVICIIDFQGKFLSVNPAAEQSWGFRQDELLGRRLREFVAPDDANKLEEILASPASIKKIAFDNQIRHKDGHLIDYAWTAHLSVSDRGLFCVARDISDRKRAERLQREFTAMVNHDLSAPLTSVAALISLIADGNYGELDSTGKERCALAGNELSRLMRLINDLLDVDRIESGSLKVSCDLISVQDVIEEAVHAVQTFAEQKKVKIHCEETELSCYADRKRIIQVMVNLLSNAVKFSPEDSTIKIFAEQMSANVRISVRDQGGGIAPEKATNLFKRFYQAHKESDRAGEGFGLGLSICKLIIDAHGGEIGCTSNTTAPGTGTEFWFTLAAFRRQS